MSGGRTRDGAIALDEIDGAQVAHHGEGEAGEARKHALVVERGADESAGLSKKGGALLFPRSAGASHDQRSGMGRRADIESVGRTIRAFIGFLSLDSSSMRDPRSLLARRPLIL